MWVCDGIFIYVCRYVMEYLYIVCRYVMEYLYMCAGMWWNIYIYICVQVCDGIYMYMCAGMWWNIYILCAGMWWNIYILCAGMWWNIYILCAGMWWNIYILRAGMWWNIYILCAGMWWNIYILCADMWWITEHHKGHMLSIKGKKLRNALVGRVCGQYSVVACWIDWLLTNNLLLIITIHLVCIWHSIVTFTTRCMQKMCALKNSIR